MNYNIKIGQGNINKQESVKFEFNAQFNSQEECKDFLNHYISLTKEDKTFIYCEQSLSTEDNLRAQCAKLSEQLATANKYWQAYHSEYLKLREELDLMKMKELKK